MIKVTPVFAVSLVDEDQVLVFNARDLAARRIVIPRKLLRSAGILNHYAFAHAIADTLNYHVEPRDSFTPQQQEHICNFASLHPRVR